MRREKFPVNLLMPYLGFYAAQAIFGTYLNLYLDDIGFTKTQMGTFTSVSTLLVLLAQPLWGYASDRAKTKNRILNILLFCGAVIILGFYLNVNYWWVMLVNCIFCVFYNPVPALMDNLTLENLENRKGGFNFGHIRIGGTIGYSIGVLAAGQLMNNQYRRMFYMISILLFIAIICLQFVPKVQGYQKKENQSSFKELLRDKKIFCFIFLNFVFSMGTVVYYSYYPLYFNKIGGDSGLVGTLMFITAISEVPFWLIAGRLVEKLGYKRMMIISAIVTGLRWILLSVAATPALAIIINLTHGFCFVTLNFCIVTYINENIPKDLRATGQSMNNMITTIFSRVIGGVAIGYLSDIFGVPTMLRIVGVAAFIGAGIFAAAYKLIENKEKAETIIAK